MTSQLSAEHAVAETIAVPRECQKLPPETVRAIAEISAAIRKTEHRLAVVNVSVGIQTGNRELESE